MLKPQISTYNQLEFIIYFNISRFTLRRLLKHDRKDYYRNKVNQSQSNQKMISHTINDRLIKNKKRIPFQQEDFCLQQQQKSRYKTSFKLSSFFSSVGRTFASLTIVNDADLKLVDLF